MTTENPTPEEPTDLEVARTARLRLRRFTDGETPLLLRVFGDPEVMRFSLGGPRDEVWCRERLAAILDSYRRDGFGLWAVEELASGSYVGYCGLKRWPEVDGRPEIELGYRYVPESWGHGYGTEAARAARDLAFGTFGLQRLISIVEPENVGSWRIAEKVGMTLEKSLQLDGVDVGVYAMTSLLA